MSAWRHKALELLPECRQLIESSDSPMALWIELWPMFDEAVEESNTKVAERVLAYAKWCISDASGKRPNDTSTAAAVAFYEHLPQRRDRWKLLPNWLSPQEFKELLPVFSYHLSESELSDLQASYDGAKSRKPVA